MAKKVKRPTDWSMVFWRDTRVLAFDPALANTGWTLISFFAAFPSPVIGATGTFSTGPEDASGGGITGSLERGDRIFRFADSLIKSLDAVQVILYEAPINQSNASFVRKAEGGPIAAMAVRAAICNNGYTPETIEVQTWKKHFTGDGHADKAKVAEVIGEVFPGLKRSNEHVRDALGCALGYMIKAERWTEHDQS